MTSHCSRALVDLRPSERQIVEIAPDRASIVNAMADAVADRGLLLLFDYGYPGTACMHPGDATGR